MANAYTQFMGERSQAPQGENLSIEEMASVYIRFMDDAKKQANELLLKEQQENLLGTIEVNPGGDEMENHEDINLRSGGEIEEPNEVEEVEEVVKELDELEEIEKESTSLELEEKNIEIETFSKMIPWAYVQEELPSEVIPYILKVEEIIMPLIEYKEASIINITIKSCEENVFKWLIEYNHRFLGTDRRENHHSFHSSMSQDGLYKNGATSWEATQAQ